MYQYLYQILVAICIVICNPSAYAAWTPRPCTSGLPEGQSMEVTTACTSDGIEVTWRPRSDDAEVELVQIEYTCRNVTADVEIPSNADVTVLLANSFATSGSRMIPLSSELQGVGGVECVVSGCSVEGWFLEDFAIPPITTTCQPTEVSTTVEKVTTTTESTVLQGNDFVHSDIGPSGPLAPEYLAPSSTTTYSEMTRSDLGLPVTYSSYNAELTPSPTIATTVHVQAETTINDRLSTSVSLQTSSSASTYNGIDMPSTTAVPSLSAASTHSLKPTVTPHDRTNHVKFNIFNISAPITFTLVAIIILLVCVIVILILVVVCMWSLLEGKYHRTQRMDHQPQYSLPPGPEKNSHVV